MALKTWQLLPELERIFAFKDGGDKWGQDSESSKATKATLSQWLSGSCLANVKNEIREPQMMGLKEEFIIDSYVRARQMEVCGSQEKVSLSC